MRLEAGVPATPGGLLGYSLLAARKEECLPDTLIGEETKSGSSREVQ